MRFRLAASAAMVACASAASAQSPDPKCPGGTLAQQAVQDACQQAIDLFNYMRPQLGLAIAGGNTTLGQGGTLGGLPHFTLSIRANIFPGTVPQPQPTSTGGAQQRLNYPTTNTPLGLPAFDAAVGVFKGIPLGVSNVGGIDLLLSASYVPKISADNVSVEPDTPVQVGYGARIGVIQESLLMPGIGVSVLRRGLPKTTITGTVQGTAGTDTLQVADLDLKTTSWRLTASKSLLLLSLAAGVGQDKYDASTTVKAIVHGPPLIGRQTASPSVSGDMTRTNYFADLSLNLLVLKIIGEVGMTSGGTVTTFNEFDKKADASRAYGSVGVRIGF